MPSSNNMAFRGRELDPDFLSFETKISCRSKDYPMAIEASKRL
jgi:hypothetical protein